MDGTSPTQSHTDERVAEILREIDAAVRRRIDDGEQTPKSYYLTGLISRETVARLIRGEEFGDRAFSSLLGLLMGDSVEGRVETLTPLCRRLGLEVRASGSTQEPDVNRDGHVDAADAREIISRLGLQFGELVAATLRAVEADAIDADHVSLEDHLRSQISGQLDTLVAVLVEIASRRARRKARPFGLAGKVGA